VCDRDHALQVCKGYESDPLNFPGNVRMRTGQQIKVRMDTFKRNYKDITLPVFGVHGDADKVTSLRAHKQFFEQISSTDKTLYVVPGGWHELVKGPQQADVVKRIAAWILDHASAPQSRSSL
jgi:acylglycerol lipase